MNQPCSASCWQGAEGARVVTGMVIPGVERMQHAVVAPTGDLPAVVPFLQERRITLVSINRIVPVFGSGHHSRRPVNHIAELPHLSVLLPGRDLETTISGRRLLDTRRGIASTHKVDDFLYLPCSM